MERNIQEGFNIFTALEVRGRGHMKENEYENSVLEEQKRGRPRAEKISTLIKEGSSSDSNIRCRVCNRVFPREKSLQAHFRTHTGEK